MIYTQHHIFNINNLIFIIFFVCLCCVIILFHFLFMLKTFKIFAYVLYKTLKDSYKYEYTVVLSTFNFILLFVVVIIIFFISPYVRVCVCMEQDWRPQIKYYIFFIHSQKFYYNFLACFSDCADNNVYIHG